MKEALRRTSGNDQTGENSSSAGAAPKRLDPAYYGKQSLVESMAFGTNLNPRQGDSFD
ncbi:hypothetical protein RBSH_02958 [Rhodopirellula baltica SH28]|uniref:Uncharacterized protein n=1 Tax=Rhodopirellula baltica SH28 TaxID=993517 RepID=K5E7C7_RHOBT|nr:hypothetical protein RBSH_02958 [Rhodopirellula baltica SH28]